MKLFKKLGKLFLVLLGILGTGAILTACGSQHTASSELVHPHHLTIGMEGVLPPYSYRGSNGQMKGFDVALSKDISKQMHLKTTFKVTHLPSLVSGLGSHRIDGVVDNISQTPKRAKSFKFSKTYSYSPYVLIVKKNNKSIKSIHNIKGKRFAEGIGADNEVVAKRWGAKILPINSLSDAMYAVREGRAAGTLTQAQAWKAFAKKDASHQQYRMIPIPESLQQPGKVSVLLNKHAPALQEKINKALTILRKNGTLKKLSEKYFHSNITVKHQKV